MARMGGTDYQTNKKASKDASLLEKYSILFFYDNGTRIFFK